MTTPTLDDVDKQFREMFAEGLSRIAMPETPEQYALEQCPPTVDETLQAYKFKYLD